MSDISGEKSPVELFNLYVNHIGINADSTEEAQAIAQQFEDLMGLAVQPAGPISVFADNLVEVMSNGGRGEKGHIGFHVDDVEAAEPWFCARGLTCDESSRARDENGKTTIVYFNEEIAGFAIHIGTRK